MATSPVPRAAPVAAAPDTSPPTPPQNVNVDLRVSPGTAFISWTGSSDDVGVAGYEVSRNGQSVGRATDRFLRDTGIRAAERYCYAVVAFDAAGNRSQPSVETCVAADVTAPAAPADVTAALANADVELRWRPSNDDVRVAGYEVLRGDAVVATLRETKARFTGLAPGRRHCHVVRAFDAAGNRSVPSAPACVLVPDVTPPTPPTELAAEAHPARVDLRWGASTDDVGVVAYEVLRGDTVVSKGAETTAGESGLTAAARYCYTVRAVDAAGNRSSPAGPVCASPPDVTPPTVPQPVAARAAGETTIHLRWGASKDDVGVVRYEVLRDGNVLAKRTETDMVITGLRVTVEYCHAVRACDAAGNCSAPSQAACVTMPDLTPPTSPTHVVAKADSDRLVTVHWTASTDNVGVTGYQVRRNGVTTVVTPGDATSARDEGLSPGTRYCYTVLAEDAAGNASAPSAVACVVTPDLTPPTVPENLAATPRAPNALVLAWEPSTDDVGVAGYEVLREGKVVATLERRQATVQLPSPDTEYCHTVRAFDAAGNRSKPSRAACARTSPAATPSAPWNLSAEVTPQQEVVLSWDPSGEAGVVYVVYWDTKRGEKSIGVTPTRSYKIFGAVAKERHCYRVAARDESMKESPRTFQACASAAHRPLADAGAVAQ